MSITLDTLDASLHSVAISDGTDTLAIDGSGNITVNAAGGSFAVTATDLDIRDLTSASDSVEIKTAAGQALSIDGSGFLTVNGNGTFTVSATDFDIRDLASSQDSVEIKTAAGQALAIDGSGFLTSNINGTVTVTATDLDVRDLTHVSDSVKIGDGTDFLAVNADGSINTNAAEDGYDAWQTSTLSATTTAAEIAASPLSARLRMVIQNLGNQDIYLGEDNTVTTSTGIKLPKGSSMDMKFGETANVWAITASGTADLRVAEFSA